MNRILITGYCIAILFATSCHTENRSKEKVSDLLGRYYISNAVYPDSVIYYHFSNDSLVLNFPTPPKHKAIQIDMSPDISSIFSVNHNRIIITHKSFKQLSDTSQFIFVVSPQDGYTYIPHSGNVILRFPYFISEPGKLSLSRHFNMFAVNTNFYAEVKDTILRRKLIDTINTFMGEQSKFPYHPKKQ